MGYSFRLAARVLLYAPSHKQDSTYHSLCYINRGALAGTRNSSMGPPPWRIDLTTHRTMSERSYHGATSRFRFFYMHHPTDRITHTTAFVTPVVEHWLEQEIAQWVHPHEGSIWRPIAPWANALITELHLVSGSFICTIPQTG